MLLSELLAKAMVAKVRNLDVDPKVTGICDYSSKVQPGNIFVAIPGYKSDGHDFAQEAIDLGAVAVIAQKSIKLPVPVIIVPDSRIALANLCNAWLGFPSKDLKMIGVTASNGKTTTTFMIDYILSSYFSKTGLMGTVIVKDGENVISADLTTPNSLELYGWLAAMRNNKCSHVTMEISSAGQELHRVHGIDYSIATFNNISREHIDFHGSFENYWQAKSKLIRNLGPHAIAVLNGDEPLIATLKEQTAAESILYTLKDDPAEIVIRNIDLSTGAANFHYAIPQAIAGNNYSLPPCDLRIQLKVLGLHNVYNATVAITVAKLCGVPDSHIIAALADFGGVERRFQLIYDGDFKVIDDHFANTGNIDLTLETLGLMKYNKLHLIIAIRGNRGSIVNGENASLVVHWLPQLPLAKLVITDSVEFVDEHDWVSDEERATFLGIMDEAGIKYTYLPQLTEAIKKILENVVHDDVVMLAGCQGMDHAAHVIIPMIAQRHPHHEQQGILNVLKDRVAGSLTSL